MHGRVSSMNNHINYEGSVDVTETETLVSLGALIRVRVVLRQGASCVHGGGGKQDTTWGQGANQVEIVVRGSGSLGPLDPLLCNQVWIVD